MQGANDLSYASSLTAQAEGGEPFPDGLVLLPKAGGYSSAKMIEQQNMVNAKQAQAHEQAKLKNLDWPRAVDRMKDTVEGLMDDWVHQDRSLGTLLGKNNRLQGIGLLMVLLALGGLLIDAAARG